jgi:hypothetical protein
MTLGFYSEKVWKINETLRAAFRSRSSRHDQTSRLLFFTILNGGRGKSTAAFGGTARHHELIEAPSNRIGFRPGK